MAAQPVTAALLADPAWLPHALAPGGVGLVRAAPVALRRAAFLDGRERFWREEAQVTTAAFVAAARAWPAGPLPSVLHVSFCGSTLLARLLDVPGRTVVYREPAIQIALADRHAAGMPNAALLRASTAALGRPVDGATAIVKPTNWANALLPDWAAAGLIRPVFVTMAPRAFLVAVFRGGRERIAFTLRVAQHLAAVVPDGPALVRAAAQLGNGPPLASAAALTLVALELQCRLFADARRQLALGAEVLIDAAAIFADPAAAARRVAALLGLADLPLAATPTTHAKAGGAHSAADEATANAAVEAGNGGSFDAAMAWAARAGLRFAA